MDNNICHFIPYHKDYHSIHTINFVLETKQQPYSLLKSQAVYKIHFVCGGKGNLHIPGKILSLSKGDIFFTFPGTPFCIETVEDFSYMYISFLGSRANMIMNKLKISAHNPHRYKTHFRFCFRYRHSKYPRCFPFPIPSSLKFPPLFYV